MNILCRGDTTKTQVRITFKRIHLLQLQIILWLKVLEGAKTRWVWIISLFNDLTHLLLQMLTLLCSNMKHFLNSDFRNDALEFYSSGIFVTGRSLFLNLDFRRNTVEWAVSPFGSIPEIFLSSGANASKGILFLRKILKIVVHWLVGLSFFLLHNLQFDILKIRIMLKIR